MPITTEELLRHIDEQHAAVVALHKEGKTAVDDVTAQYNKLSGQLLSLQQKMDLAERGGPSGGYAGSATSMGSIVASSAQMSDLRNRRYAGTVRIQVTAALNTSTLAPVPERTGDLLALPRRRLTARNLLAPGQTNSNLVQFTRMTGRTNNARPVSEGAEKPESGFTFELAETPVRTIATWVPASRQVMDDVPQLQSLIDTELRYMIGYEEEVQLLYGDGTGENVEGLSTQATPYSPPFAVDGETMLDTILLGIAQAQQSGVLATGVVVNDQDWKQMQATKDEQGRYIGGGPFGQIGNSLWTLPVVDTPAVPVGDFFVGAFAIAAQVIDRMATEVVISTEDRDNFIKNMVTVRAEERVALAVKIPSALVYGQYPSGV